MNRGRVGKVQHVHLRSYSDSHWIILHLEKAKGMQEPLGNPFERDSHLGSSSTVTVFPGWSVFEEDDAG